MKKKGKRFLCRLLILITGTVSVGQASASAGAADLQGVSTVVQMIPAAVDMNETDGPATGLPYLNEVRRRAGLAAIAASEVPVRYAFREKLEKERRLELAFENQRWFDLLRWGKAVEVVNKQITETEGFYNKYAFTVNKIADWQLLLPIPQSVIDNNPSVVTQNPNY